MKQALEDDKRIGIVQLRPGWEEDYYGQPPIYRVLGVGEIMDAEPVEDGRYDIVLKGLFKARMVEESEPVSDEEFRTVTAEILSDEIGLDERSEVYETHEILCSIFDKLSQALPEGMTLLPGKISEDLPPGALVDILASLLVDDPYERQSLLSEISVLRRQQLLRVQIRNILSPKPFDYE